MQLTFSRHAVYRLHSRGVSRDRAYRVVRDGESRPRHRGRTLFSLGGVHVLVSREMVVVTVWKDRPLGKFRQRA